MCRTTEQMQTIYRHFFPPLFSGYRQSLQISLIVMVLPVTSSVWLQAQAHITGLVHPGSAPLTVCSVICPMLALCALVWPLILGIGGVYLLGFIFQRTAELNLSGWGTLSSGSASFLKLGSCSEQLLSDSTTRATSIPMTSLYGPECRLCLSQVLHLRMAAPHHKAIWK